MKTYRTCFSCFAILVIVIASSQACSAGAIPYPEIWQEDSLNPGQTHDNCKVLTIGKSTHDKAEVTFISNGIRYDAAVPCPSTMYNKLKAAKDNGTLVQITLSRNNEVTGVK